MEKDYYKILGLSPDCTAKQIRAQFRMLAKKYHPDKHKGNHRFVKRFHAIKEAHDTLIKEDLRKEYDNLYGYRNEEPIEESEPIPFIISFRCNTKTFTVGEAITFHWEVRGADYIEIKPFGQVHLQKGSKTVRITDDVKTAKIKILKVKIVAKNTKTGEFVSEIINLEHIRNNQKIEPPSIISFYYETGSYQCEPITFHWEVTSADHIEIELFGRVYGLKGSKTFEKPIPEIIPEEGCVEVTETRLIATNIKTNVSAQKHIYIEREVRKTFATSNNSQTNSKPVNGKKKMSISSIIMMFLFYVIWYSFHTSLWCLVIHIAILLLLDLFNIIDIDSINSYIEDIISYYYVIAGFIIIIVVSLAYKETKNQL